ncbi:DUF1326 domain-containing protein [Ovoidimarina sediminis]|uniref:DUF1326 domain-containing protein n=1 Tax=Ovoidimarina sediminis TaxID=3079856 RepID=UPI002910D2E3|nr:DUF1326 domain-containing protein [Rhodophyticola sp. MJ-SS7]MDU8946365.1 DUF1326 domain-containing protein [Rhodophyticola sp. MJ-SS7]
MTWSLSGELVETCSCNMLCPCWFGQADLMLMDQGYCATSLLLRVREGSYEGVDLAGQNAIVSLHFPGPTLFDADGTGRVYIDEGASDEQASALETILQGASGGGMEVPSSLLSSWLPTRRVAISVSEADGEVSAKVAGIGELKTRRLVNDLGKKMSLKNAAFSVAFGHDAHEGDLAPSDGTVWNDDEMPVNWQGRSGVVGQVSWAG